MKHYTLRIAALSAALVMALPIAQANEWTGNVGGSYGRKTLDGDDWDNLDKQSEAGFMLAIKKESWPVSITYDLFVSHEEDEVGTVTNEGFTVENQFGIRKSFEWDGSRLRPYIGGGITVVSAEIETRTADSSSKDDDWGTGYWLGAGLLFRVAESFDIGADVRYSDADVDIFGNGLEAGGMHYNLTASYHW